MSERSSDNAAVTFPRAILGCGTFGGIGRIPELIGTGLDDEIAFATLDDAAFDALDRLQAEAEARDISCAGLPITRVSPAGSDTGNGLKRCRIYFYHPVAASAGKPIRRRFSLGTTPLEPLVELVVRRWVTNYWVARKTRGATWTIRIYRAGN